MQDIIAQIHKLLLKKQKTIATAESCSGGLLSSLLTKMSGSSRYFILGVTTYSNKAKESILGIRHSSITKNGAVSAIVASKMAGSVRRIAKTSLGIGITGIAGPGGGTPQKPVGTVFIAIDSPNKQICKRFLFKGDRTTVRRKAASKALELLKAILIK
ncbi:MAG: CinA family protein [Candidatus Omnitrophica bacterium]|nr:CinA family protein [Candidatus Omnitrophota bacterium]